MPEREFVLPDSYLPKVMPSTWALSHADPIARCYDSVSCRVLASVAKERDGNLWLHLSLSRRDRQMPRWDDIQLMRTIFAPKDAHGYMCFPPESEYVHCPAPGINVEVLHIFYALNHRPLPDFRPDTESLGL